ncbi:MAG: hypothetical protein HYY76_11765 [Acidobacteria bacterium]|nr:hypothetical protein [Acidobacteriota bacterium]
MGADDSSLRRVALAARRHERALFDARTSSLSGYLPPEAPEARTTSDGFSRGSEGIQGSGGHFELPHFDREGEPFFATYRHALANRVADILRGFVSRCSLAHAAGDCQALGNEHAVLVLDERDCERHGRLSATPQLGARTVVLLNSVHCWREPIISESNDLLVCFKSCCQVTEAFGDGSLSSQ